MKHPSGDEIVGARVVIGGTIGKQLVVPHDEVSQSVHSSVVAFWGPRISIGRPQAVHDLDVHLTEADGSRRPALPVIKLLDTEVRQYLPEESDFLFGQGGPLRTGDRIRAVGKDEVEQVEGVGDVDGRIPIYIPRNAGRILTSRGPRRDINVTRAIGEVKLALAKKKK